MTLLLDTQWALERNKITTRETEAATERKKERERVHSEEPSRVAARWKAVSGG
jgi:hypothetical protein